jgi:hypothetical protein
MLNGNRGGLGNRGESPDRCGGGWCPQSATRPGGFESPTPSWEIASGSVGRPRNGHHTTARQLTADHCEDTLLVIERKTIHLRAPAECEDFKAGKRRLRGTLTWACRCVGLPALSLRIRSNAGARIRREVTNNCPEPSEYSIAMAIRMTIDRGWCAGDGSAWRDREKPGEVHAGGPCRGRHIRPGWVAV